MGVDFYPCSRCGEVYCDCGEFVTCSEDALGCGRDWCSYECAKEDGYIEEYCRFDKEVEYGYCQEKCDLSNNGDCTECSYYVHASCKYCRGEDYNDSELLQFALKKLNMSREDLINEINNFK